MNREILIPQKFLALQYIVPQVVYVSQRDKPSAALQFRFLRFIDFYRENYVLVYLNYIILNRSIDRNPISCDNIVGPY